MSFIILKSYRQHIAERGVLGIPPLLEEMPKIEDILGIPAGVLH